MHRSHVRQKLCPTSSGPYLSLPQIPASGFNTTFKTFFNAVAVASSMRPNNMTEDWHQQREFGLYHCFRGTVTNCFSAKCQCLPLELGVWQLYTTKSHSLHVQILPVHTHTHTQKMREKNSSEFQEPLKKRELKGTVLRSVATSLKMNTTLLPNLLLRISAVL